MPFFMLDSADIFENKRMHMPASTAQEYHILEGATAGRETISDHEASRSYTSR
jgi:hypothetical protein